MGNYTSIYGTYSKVGYSSNKKLFFNDNVDGSLDANQNVFDGYLRMLRLNVTSSSNLFIPLENVENDSFNVKWLHIPNNTTNDTLYQLLQSESLLSEYVHIHDFGGAQSSKLWFILILGITLYIASLNSVNKSGVMALFVIASLITYFSVNADTAPKQYYTIDNIPEGLYLPLAKQNTSAIKSKFSNLSLENFASQVLKTIKTKNAIPHSLLNKGIQSTFLKDGSTSTVVHKDDTFTVELSSFSPNTSVASHTHDVDVAVIALSEGLTYSLDNSEEKEAKPHNILKINKNTEHTFKSGVSGGYLMSIHSYGETKQSLFQDL